MCMWTRYSHAHKVSLYGLAAFWCPTSWGRTKPTPEPPSQSQAGAPRHHESPRHGHTGLTDGFPTDSVAHAKRLPALPHGRRTTKMGKTRGCVYGLRGRVLPPRRGRIPAAAYGWFLGASARAKGAALWDGFRVFALWGPWVASRVAPPRAEVADSKGDPSRAIYTRARAADRATQPHSQPPAKAQRATEKR